MSRACPPIAVFAFNRPAHLERTLLSLAACRLAPQSDIHIFCDGPRTDADRPAVKAVRQVAGNRRWRGRVRVITRERNLGLAGSVTAGVSELCREHGRVIVIEDDLLLSPAFLEYMRAALDKYADDERVMQISGFMFQVDYRPPAAGCFLPLVTSWGWGTWNRAWRHYDPGLSGYQDLATDPRRRRRFDVNGAYGYFALLERVRRAEVDSWALPWYLSVFQRGGLTLYPARSLVYNAGFDGTGRHCAATPYPQDRPAPALETERLPAVAVADQEALAAVEAFYRARARANRPPWWRRTGRRVRAWLRGARRSI